MSAGQKLVYTVFLALFFSAFVCTQSMPVAAANGIAMAPVESDIEEPRDVQHENRSARTKTESPK